MASKPNEPHDKFIKQYIPIVLKHLFNSQTSIPVRLNEELAIDVLCTALPQPTTLQSDPALGLLGRLVAIHPTIIIEHYSNYLELEDIDSCILRSSIYWELNKDKTDTTSKTRLTKESALYPQPLQPERPFTWIFAARCGDNLLKRWNATPDPEFGAAVYRLAAPGLAMGLVNIEALPYNADTMVLKMLGKAESAKQAFTDIIALDSQRELRSDIIEVSLKHCIYLERFRAELTPEELSFMTYLQDVESAYQEWVKERRAEGKLEGFHEGKLEGIYEGKLEGIREGKLEGIREGKLEGIREGKLEGKLQIANKLVRAKFGGDASAPAVTDRLSILTEAQLDELTTKIFEWQNLDRLLEWLDSLPGQ